MVLLCEMLTRLKVLQLWANLHDLRDINFTGIKTKFYFVRQSDGQLYLKKDEVVKEKREPCIYNLKRNFLLKNNTPSLWPDFYNDFYNENLKRTSEPFHFMITTTFNVYYCIIISILKRNFVPDLRQLSLRGLGRDVTDLTCRFAFEGMKFLKFIELAGDTSVNNVEHFFAS